jgi:hypothetical protein
MKRRHIPDDSTSNLRWYRHMNAKFRIKQMTCHFLSNSAQFMCMTSKEIWPWDIHELYHVGGVGVTTLHGYLFVHFHSES